MDRFLSSLMAMFLFVSAVFAAVVPFVASPVAAASVPRSEPLCAPLGSSTAPEPSSQALAAFTDDRKYDQLAHTAPIPAGYALTMNNANCAFSSDRYMLYVQLDSYSPETCAELCNKHEGCDSFNIYIQRDPSQIPGPACPNPAPIAVTKCALYSLPEVSSSCTNFGQHIGPADASGEAFKIAIRSSNAYNKVSGKQVTVAATTTHHVHKTVTTTVTKTLTARNEQHYHGVKTKFINVHRPTVSSSVVSSNSAASGTVTITLPWASQTGMAPAGTITVTATRSPVPVSVITVTSTRSSAPGSTVTVTSTRRFETTVTSFGGSIGTTYTIYNTEDVYKRLTTSLIQRQVESNVVSQYASIVTVTAPVPEVTTITLSESVATPSIEASNPYLTTITLSEPVPTPSASASNPYLTTITITSPLPAATSAKSSATNVPMMTITLDEQFSYTYVGPADVPLKTITLNDSYTYTGPTDVPMKTITLGY